MKLSFQLGIILITILVVKACGERKHFKIVKEDSTYLPTRLSEIVAQITASPSYDEEYVGLVGAPSIQYARFIRMNEIANDSQLIALTNHSNSIVRAYAMRALGKRHYYGLEALIKTKTGDTSKIEHVNGCIGLEETVSDYNISVLISEKAYQYEKTLPPLK